MDPRAELLRGIEVLRPILEPAGFAFNLEETGASSGGDFASGSFQRANRRLELHFRRSLGLVSYQVGIQSLSHVQFAKAQNQVSEYPGFGSESIDAFRRLAIDLNKFGAIFIRGTDADFAKVVQASLKQPKRTGFAALGH